MTMNYEDRYNEALKIARGNYNAADSANINVNSFKNTLTTIFPELKESDEKIRQFLIHEVTETSDEIMSYRNMNKKEVLDWLEKQESVGEIVERCKDSWYNEGKIQGKIEGLSDDEKYQQGWHDALEKQGEQKPVEWSEEDSVRLQRIIDFLWYNRKGDTDTIYQQEQDIDWLKSIKDRIQSKQSNKVEPKFKVGDFIVYNDDGCTCQIKSIRENDYCIWPLDSDVEGWLEITDIDNKCHLWTIQDAKDGDVLVASDGSIFLFAGVVDCACKYYVVLTADNYVKINKEVESGFWETSRAVHPATKEQRDTLFAKMKEAGHEWDSEKKELKKIE